MAFFKGAPKLKPRSRVLVGVPVSPSLERAAFPSASNDDVDLFADPTRGSGSGKPLLSLFPSPVPRG